MSSCRIQIVFLNPCVLVLETGTGEMSDSSSGTENASSGMSCHAGKQGNSEVP
jgi:hypothetical protein